MPPSRRTVALSAAEGDRLTLLAARLTVHRAARVTQAEALGAALGLAWAADDDALDAYLPAAPGAATGKPGGGVAPSEPSDRQDGAGSETRTDDARD
jgi:hypothetical protein